jgi:integrase
MESAKSTAITREPWNKDKLVGQKTPFKLKEIWAIRVRLQIARRCRDLARIFCSQAAYTHRPTYQHGSTPGSLTHGFNNWDWIPQVTVPHTLRRTKATLIYRRTKNLRAVQLLLGHTKLESTVRYLGIEVDDALEMAEQTEV